MLGGHLWHSSSSTQVPVSLSSGEAETYCVTKACSWALGTKFLAVDLGFELHGTLRLKSGPTRALRSESTNDVGKARSDI